MRQNAALKAAALLVALLSLNGCVAAAIPLVAGAAVARTATDGQEPGDAEQAQAERQAALNAQVELSELAAAPPPIAVENLAPASTPRSLADADEFSDLIRYASEASQPSAGQAVPPSAILLDSTSLREKRAPCLANLPTVLIDLDPEDGQFALEGKDRIASPTLVEGLAQLREEGISIVWISGHSAADADRVRVQLKRSGLDPDSTDQMLLMRYPGDRKQTRRQDLAEVSCIIAIAGDSRSDFDELFDYLVNPEAALALELLIGQGWFLIPPVLAEPHSQTVLSKD
ncbi:MAG: hypothetical protein AAGK01_01645 [Pseudomonadota bacterium]